mmetsp:Transcript_3436/g.13071  ORF Transcript_3436/g.13071 Transcript_3436/m.13071 type:complete len:234 (+) Transcript_3436:1496-2197(+)
MNLDWTGARLRFAFQCAFRLHWQKECLAGSMVCMEAARSLWCENRWFQLECCHHCYECCYLEERHLSLSYLFVDAFVRSVTFPVHAPLEVHLQFEIEQLTMSAHALAYSLFGHYWQTLLICLVCLLVPAVARSMVHRAGHGDSAAEGHYRLQLHLAWRYLRSLDWAQVFLFSYSHHSVNQLIQIQNYPSLNMHPLGGSRPKSLRAAKYLQHPNDVVSDPLHRLAASEGPQFDL